MGEAKHHQGTTSPKCAFPLPIWLSYTKRGGCLSQAWNEEAGWPRPQDVGLSLETAQVQGAHGTRAVPALGAAQMAQKWVWLTRRGRHYFERGLRPLRRPGRGSKLCGSGDSQRQRGPPSTSSTVSKPGSPLAGLTPCSASVYVVGRERASVHKWGPAVPNV